MICRAEHATLLIIDVQEKLLPAIADVDRVLGNVERLARTAKLVDVPVRATEQNPRGLGPNSQPMKSLTTATLEKQFFDATREPSWTGFLPPTRAEVVVAGCEAHVCVLQTVLGLRRLGHPVWLVADAIGSRTTANRDRAIDRAQTAGATIVTTEMVIFEWLGTAEHPAFRTVLPLVR